MNINYKENGGKKSFFFANQSINIVYLNVENMIVVPIAKRMDIIMSIQVCLISRMNNNYKENGGRKSFFANQSLNILYAKGKNMIVASITKRMEIIMRIQVYLISWINFDYEEYDEKKRFSCKSKALISSTK